MKLSVKPAQPDKFSKACLLVGLYSGGNLTPTAKLLDDMSQGYISKIIKQSAFEAKPGQTLPVFHLANTNIDQIIFVGCGDEANVTPASFRKIVQCATKSLTNSKANQSVSYLSVLN